MNNSEGQTQESVGGMKWEDVQVLAKKHAEQIIEMGWRDNPDKDDIIADFISGYASAAPIKTEGEDEINLLKRKLNFYREQTDKVRELVFIRNDIGEPCQPLYDAIFDKIVTQEKEIERLKAAPPSPVGIYVEELATSFADSKERRGCSYWQGLYNGFKAGYSASLPQSSTEEEKELWDKVVFDVRLYENDSREYDTFIEQLLSTYKISKR